MGTTKLNIGKIPISKGEYQEGTTYQRLNQVTMFGSTYQSKIDNNVSAPAQMDADGVVENINTDKWLCVAVGNVSAAKKVVYNNETSGLEAENVQGAIDELANKKANKETVNTELDKKANTADVDSKFADEAARVNVELEKKANAEDVEQSFSDQTAKNTAQDAEISKKANSADVTSQMQAEQSRVNTELEKKFDKESILQESGDAEDKVMSQKATSVELNKKADKEEMNRLLMTKVNTADVDTEPTIGSDNLVKSGGVADKIFKLKKTIGNIENIHLNRRDSIDLSLWVGQKIYYNITADNINGALVCKDENDKLIAQFIGEREGVIPSNTKKLMCDYGAITIHYIKCGLNSNKPFGTYIQECIDKNKECIDKNKEQDNKIEILPTLEERTNFLYRNFNKVRICYSFNGFIDAKGNTISRTNSKATEEYYPVNKNIRYIFTGVSQWGAMAFAYYDKDKKKIATYPITESDTPLYYNDNDVYKLLQPTEDVAYIRFSTINIKKPYGVKVINDAAQYRLYNTNILFFGDSLMSARSDEAKGGVVKILADKTDNVLQTHLSDNSPLPSTFDTIGWHNIGRDGTTISKKSSRTDSILERVKNWTETEHNIDFILFQGGTNDFYYNSKGNISSEYEGSFDEFTSLGALEELCRYITTKGIKSGFVIFPVAKNIPDEYFDDYVSVCKKWGVPVLDLRYNGGFTLKYKQHRILYSITNWQYPAYNASVTYNIDDKVSYNGKLYKCKSDGVENIVPTNTEYWILVSDESCDGLHPNYDGYDKIKSQVERFIESNL